MAPAVKVTAPVEGRTVTVLVAVVDPQRPDADAVIVAVPKNDASQFITPVEGSIAPAAAGDTE